MNEFVHTVRAVELVYGGAGPALDDPAELYHEASKAYPRLLAAQLPGVALLRMREDLQVSARRSVRRNPELEWLELPEPRLPSVPLSQLLAARRSEREFGSDAVGLPALSTLLRAAYGVTCTADYGQAFRTVPSGGALYPLELYVCAAAVEGLDGGIYHFDPLTHRIARIRGGDGMRAVQRASTYPEITGSCALAVLVTAVFWRTRFKYGLRGYRFALLEAGHVVQNLVLTATALELAAVPLGGYYDRAVDEVLGLDGVNESVLYAACVGSRT